ncbi:MAG: P27 family phage terminase small subunit [Acetobacteraceae bacterium]|nr:P27 family phage terminase small subunit [Acetobacteraceae bacterium]MBV8525011.1 P27 family phage terminase small subunit [Acetobacteraceae bacterium]
MRGRKPTPISILKTRGTLRKGRHGKRMHEPQAPGGLSGPPEWLTPSQQEIWRHAIADAPAGVLKEIDQGVLTIWVTAVDQHRTAILQQAKLDADAKLPLLIKSRDGTAAASPYIRVATRAADLMLRAGAELGFTPASRPRLAGAGAMPTASDPNSPWARLRILQGGRADDEPPASA